MKFSRMEILLSLLSVTGRSAGAYGSKTEAQANPLGQTISLVTDLSAKVKADGEAEAKAYDELYRWCRGSSQDLTHSIEEATRKSEKLNAKIDELSADIEVAEGNIDELAAAASKGTADLNNANAIREKERGVFVIAEKELVDVVDTLGRAIGILERESTKNPASFAQMQKDAGGNLASVLQSLSIVVDAAAFSNRDKLKLLGLVQEQQDDDDLNAPNAATYKTHSTGIIDTLEDMKEKAETQLSDLREAETNTQHNYAMLKQSLEDQLAADNKELEEEKANKAGAEEQKATAEGDLAMTQKDLAAGEGELETTKANCLQAAADHELSTKARAEELKVIAEAIKVLQSTTSGAVGQTYSLLQLKAVSTSGSGLAGSKVINMVKELSRKYHSVALAQLTSRIEAVAKFGAENGQDPFAKVTGLIKDMIQKLEGQAESEATEKAYCDEEMAKTEAKKGDLEDDTAKLTAKIDQAMAKSAELKGEVQQLQSELAGLAKEQAELDKIRQDSHEDYVMAKKDLEEGLGGVRKAIQVLKDYYSKDDGSASLLQDNIHNIMHQPAMPESFKKSTGAGSSIIGILEVVESDFATGLTAEESTEADAADEYDKTTQENAIAKTEKEQSVKYKTQESIALDKSISELSADRDTFGTELSAVNEYYGKLRGRCVAKPETYEERKRRRTAEVEGLKQALAVLDGEAALLQHRTRGRRNMRGAATALEAE